MNALASSTPALSALGLAVPGRLEAMDLGLAPGQLVAVLGPNGAGKSTLLQALAGLLPFQGQVQWQGEDLDRIPFLDRGRRLAWLAQDTRVDFAFPVEQVVQQGRYAHGEDHPNGVVGDLLDQLDLAHLAKRPVTRLSGGERQRVFLARALATEAPVQLWDEPLAQLDVRHGLEVLALAKALSIQGRTVLMSIHDLRLALSMDHVLLLDQGRLRAQGAPEVVLTEAMIHDVFRVHARTQPALTLELP